MKDLQITALRKENPIAWMLMPQAMARAKRFCVELGSDMDPDFLEQAMQLNFVSDDPRLCAWVGHRGGKVVGHAIATIDEAARANGEAPARYLTILHFEADEYAERDLLMAAFEMMLEWGRTNYCETVQLLTKDEGRERLFQRYGFKRHRILMRRSI